MVNSYNTKAEIKQEVERLQMLIAALEYDLLCFAIGGNSLSDVSKAENELFFYKLRLKYALKRQR